MADEAQFQSGTLKTDILLALQDLGDGTSAAKSVPVDANGDPLAIITLGPLAPATGTATGSLIGGGIYNASLPVFAEGNQGANRLDINGRLIVLPHGRYQSTPPTLANGDKQDFLFNNVGGLVISGPTNPGNPATGWPVQIGGIVRTSNNYAANSQAQRAVLTTGGSLIVRPYSIPQHEVSYAAAAGGIVNTTTGVTIFAAAGAGIKTYITGLHISHDVLGGATELVLRDGASGTVKKRFKLQTAAVENYEIKFDNPIAGTANTLWEVATLTAVTGGVFVNAEGFVAE